MNARTWVGERVELRAKTREDIPKFLADGKVEDMRLYGDGYVPFPASDEFREQLLNDDIDRVRGEDCSLAIVDRSGELVGSINATDCDPRSGSFWYGVAIFESCQRRGFAIDAAKILLRYYFEERGYHRVGGRVYSFNEPSIRLQERLGFTLEGRHRETVFTRGERHDLLIYGMLAREFFEMWGR